MPWSARKEKPPDDGRSEIGDQVAASAAASFRFLRQPNKPNAPRPVAKSGSAAGSGVGSISKLPDLTKNRCQRFPKVLQSYQAQAPKNQSHKEIQTQQLRR